QEDNQQFPSNVITAPTDLRLLSLSPHMHLRGKSFRYEMTLPDGRKETLLDVPHYDFNWQTAYALADELVIPKGAKIQGFAAFDNSPNNLANPDPSATVTWGDQSWEEMLLGYFDVAIPRSQSSTVELGQLAQRVRNGNPADIAKELLARLDRNDNGLIEREELPERQRVFFDQLDADKSGSLTPDELATGLKALRAATKPKQ
ncbi:MAG TPA: redoxin, partial [Planctomycetaceae bacterium]|nr:redoxin [Planctomycetaceae bacterium]